MLVTFYFTQELLPSIAAPSAEGAASLRTAEAVEFVKTYGAYLRLHLCLVCAVMARADFIIEELLALSKYDPRHREVTKVLSKANSLVLYDPVRDFLRHLGACFVLLQVSNHCGTFGDRRCYQQ